MPGTIADGPAVSMSFANNFWGKDDAGVHPLLERMHNAKVTSDELKIFYNTRAAIEDEYARKLLALCRKPLGSCEAGTLRSSLDTMRGEVDTMAKSHQSIAAQMKSELEEPLAAFAGGMKERRKIVQTGIEKLFKIKCQQTLVANKARDRYEQDCLRIKGYLAQGHMVMGQEERKNKAKLEKTQISVANSNAEYEAAIKVLEETTGRWNRDWKAACDKFQDLEEERLDFMKSSLWSFANISSTVCVTDDASCEKIRLSLEGCEVEKDINTFIREKGTGQEIPDPPKYINFCRGDVNDSQSEQSEDDQYSVAQFPRSINPAYRTSSPQPSTYESHHDPNSALAAHMGHGNIQTPPSRETTLTPQHAAQQHQEQQRQQQQQQRLDYQEEQHGKLAAVPHNEYPQDGMTMYCRTGPPSERSSAPSPARPSSRDSQSDYSNPTSFSSIEPTSGKQSPVKGNSNDDQLAQKKKSGFFQGHSPFRRKSKRDLNRNDEASSNVTTPSSRNTWSARLTGGSSNTSPTRRPPAYGQDAQAMVLGDPRHMSGSPEPADPRANFQLNVGNNVFDVASPDKRQNNRSNTAPTPDTDDPIAAALAELKGVTKASSIRQSADRYHGLSTPAPDAKLQSQQFVNPVSSAQRGTPPPSYDTPMKRLDLPQPAFTSAQMQQTRQKYIDQTAAVFGSPQAPRSAQSSSRPSTRGNSSINGAPLRATSPAPPRSASPRPGYGSGRQQPSSAQGRYQQGGYGSRQHSPADRQDNHSIARSASPSPMYAQRGAVGSEMTLAMPPQQQQQDGESMYRGSGGRGRHGAGRPTSYYDGGGGSYGSQHGQQQGGRQRSKSTAAMGSSDGRQQMTRDGRQIINYARALYLYTAAIPEELSFGKGDIVAVLRLQDDGWWEAEVVRSAAGGGIGGRGLVPSNYLVVC